MADNAHAPPSIAPGAAVGQLANQLERRISHTIQSHEHHEAKDLSDSSSSSNSDAIGVDGANAERIHTLARTLSRASAKARAANPSEPINPFTELERDPSLDPKSEKFSPRRWMQNLLQVRSRDPELFPTRTAGVSYTDLNVFGYGTAADFQGTVANIWSLSSLKNFFGLGGKRRIDILRNFEGLVESGELLVVLGRPGR